MKSTNHFRLLVVLVLISAAALILGSWQLSVPKSSVHSSPALAQRPDASKLKIVNAYGMLPLSFEVNQGQTDPQVKFLSHGSGYALYLTPTEAVLSLRKPALSGEKDAKKLRGMLEIVSPKGIMRTDGLLSGGKSTVLRMRFVGSNRTPDVMGLEELPGKNNYFIGNDSKKWRINVPNYAKVEYKEIYPSVDLVYYGNQGQLEHDFILAPGANPSAITMEIKGADKLFIDLQGDLVCATGTGEVRLQKPVAYQEVNGARKEIVSSYVLRDRDDVGFEFGPYDAGSRLVIDPVLSFSTYLGGSDFDFGLGIAVDSSGNAYVTGSTSSSNFPTTLGAFQTTSIQGGTFVTKLNSTGSALVYSTYLDGSGGFGIAVDSSGNAYVTGGAGFNFPTTAGAFQRTLGGFQDAFVTKLNPDGSALVYSTYLGGSDFEEGRGIALDSSGSAYVTGGTSSTNFPTSTEAFQTTFGGGFLDTFVSKLNPDGSALVYSTYLGSSDFDEGLGIALDSSGNAYVTGGTSSTNFPTTPGAFQTTLGGFQDAFVTKLNPDGSALVYSTYLGSGDGGFGIALDSSGNAYVTGFAGSTQFPTTIGAFQTTFGGGFLDTFVTKLNPDGSGLVYSTYLGGSDDEEGLGIAVDSSGSAYVTGWTFSIDFPTTTGAFQTTLGGFQDVFVTKLNPNGSALVYSTYLGGNDVDKSFGIAVDSSGNAYVTGETFSTNFATTPGAFQVASGGNADVFVAKIGAKTPAQMISDLVNAVNSFGLQPGISISLDAKLQAAQASLAANNIASCNQMTAFIYEVMAQSGKALTVGQANQLIVQANLIKTDLSCQ
jgi:beta-propeller repeat-containing protein